MEFSKFRVSCLVSHLQSEIGPPPFLDFFFIYRFYLFILDRREGEEHQCLVASHMPPLGYLAHNPGVCPDWESNQRPFSSQAFTQSTEPHQPGLLDF